MKMNEKLEGNALTIALEGNFDEFSSPLIEEKIGKNLEEQIKRLLLDLGRVNYISSAGIRVLILAHKAAVKKDKEFIVVDMSEKVREVLEMVGILPLITVRGGVCGGAST
jgi:anti-sigma B factor antagonist